MEEQMEKTGGLALEKKGFRMGELISTGGFSLVYRCNSGNKEYAVKLQNIQRYNADGVEIDDEKDGRIMCTDLDDFKSEVRILNMLTQFIPNNVPKMLMTFTAFFPEIGKRVGIIIMEEWEGGMHKLVRYIANQHRDDPTVAAMKLQHYGKIVANLFRHIQNLGITHYDSKPSNILFRGDPGQNEDCGLVDFAISDFGHAHDYTTEIGYDGFRSCLTQPSNYDVAMFQFCFRAEAAINYVPIENIKFLPNAEYLAFVEKYAVKDEWVIPRWDYKDWARQEKNKFK